MIFLDYDGVVNTPMWNEKGTSCRYNFPSDGKVNNFQAVQWLSEACKKFHYDIVVTSTWRTHANYQECLINGGLREGIEILGKTERLSVETGWARGHEIQKYLEDHPEIKYFMIVDDEYVPINETQKMHFIQTKDDFGSPPFTGIYSTPSTLREPFTTTFICAPRTSVSATATAPPSSIV